MCIKNDRPQFITTCLQECVIIPGVKVIVVGGGFAGLAAISTLCQSGGEVSSGATRGLCLF